MKFAVVGVGTSGLMAAGQILNKYKEHELDVIYTPNIPIVGIGESTTPEFSRSLYECIGFSHLEDLEKLKGTIKHAVLHTSWGKDEFLFNFPGHTHSYHIDALNFKDFMFEKLEQVYGDRFNAVTAEVGNVLNEKDSVKLEVNGVYKEYDYIFDCRGYPKNPAKDEYTHVDMLVNKCFVYNEPGGANWGYTRQTWHPNGWMFSIPLPERVSHGYVFNDRFTTDEEALENFYEIIGTKPEADKIKQFNFSSYYSNKPIDNRIIKVGNRGVFFSPLSANSLYLTSMTIKEAFSYISGKANQEFVNESIKEYYRSIIDLTCLYFKYGPTGGQDSKFWNEAAIIGKERLEKSDMMQEIIDNRFDIYENGNIYMLSRTVAADLRTKLEELL